jgi:hypothetical protein
MVSIYLSTYLIFSLIFSLSIYLSIYLQGILPASTSLPMFLLRLALNTNWDDEKSCFISIANELSILFSTNEVYEDSEMYQNYLNNRVGNLSIYLSIYLSNYLNNRVGNVLSIYLSI